VRLRASVRPPRSASNALVVAKLAVVLTARRLYALALTDFWHVHRAIEHALEAERSRCAGACRGSASPGALSCSR
jgi:hypothetical protein